MFGFKTKIFILIFSVFISIVFCMCAKKLFSNGVKIHGRIINTRTQQPGAVELNLMTDSRISGTSASAGSILLGKTTSSSNGEFILEGDLEKRNVYYIKVVHGNTAFAIIGGTTSFAANTKGTTELGDITDWW